MKKTLTLSIAITFILSFNLFAGSAATSENNAIHKLWNDFESAYNSGDAAAIASLWVKDGDLFTLSGGIFKGRDEIAKFFSKSLSVNYKGSKFKLTIDQIRKLQEDVAVVDGIWEVTGQGLPKNYPTKGIYTQVLIRSENKWWIVAARPSIPLKGHTRNHGREKKAESADN